MEQEILNVIQKVVEGAAGKKINDFSEELRLTDLPIDSLDLYTVIEDLEQLSGKSLSDEDFSSMNAVGDLARFFS